MEQHLKKLPLISQYLIKTIGSAPLYHSRDKIYGLGHSRGSYSLFRGEDAAIETTAINARNFDQVMEEIQLDPHLTIIQSWLILPYHKLWYTQELGVEGTLPLGEGDRREVSYLLFSSSQHLLDAIAAAEDYECDQRFIDSVDTAQALIHLIMRMGNPANVDVLPDELITELMHEICEELVGINRVLRSDQQLSKTLFSNLEVD